MASTKFELSKKDRNGTSELIVRFCYDRKHSYRLHTNIWVPRTAWNPAKGKLIIPRMHGKEQKRLSQLQAKVDDLSNFLKTESIDAPQSADKNYWIKKIRVFNNGVLAEPDSATVVSDVCSESSERIIDAFNAFIEARIKNDKTKRHMITTMDIVRRYILYSKGCELLKDWTGEDLADFQEFLRIEHTFFENGICKKKWAYIYKGFTKKRVPKKRGGNRIHSIMKMLRIMFNWCVRTDRIEKSPFSTFHLDACVFGTPFYMTIDELNTLYHFDFSNNSKLAIQRDIFVLQSNLGMRVGDFYSLTSANIINDAIEYIPGKTLHDSGDVVRVPLTERAKEIINRYQSGSDKSLVPFICEQKYNEAIKAMLKLAGIDRMITILNPTTRIEERHPIWEKASSHMARRNFIGNLYAQVQDPALISSMTGHKPGSRAFERYRAIHDEIKKPILKIFD